MKQTVSKFNFRDAFQDCGRGEQFSYEGLGALYDYLDELETDTGEEIELDVIALCCEYSEYDDLEAFQSDYNEDVYKTLDDIQDETTIIVIPGTSRFIIQQF